LKLTAREIKMIIHALEVERKMLNMSLSRNNYGGDEKMTQMLETMIPQLDSLIDKFKNNIVIHIDEE
jgi:uncharacterized protein YsxB (DUF464 family)